jgi:hypothetical protein
MASCTIVDLKAGLVPLTLSQPGFAPNFCRRIKRIQYASDLETVVLKSSEMRQLQCNALPVCIELVCNPESTEQSQDYFKL